MKSQFLKDKHLHYNYPDILNLNKTVACDPVTIMTVTAMTVTAAAGGYQAYNQRVAARAQKKMYAYQESLVQQEQALTRQTAEEQTGLIKRTSERNIEVTQNAAAEESKRLARGVGAILGTQKAAMGALGISGVTAANILTDTFDKAQLDQIAIRYNADVKSWEYAEKARTDIWNIREETKNRIWALGEEGKQLSYAGKYAVQAGRKAATATLLQTAASVAMIGAKFLPSGGGGGGGGGGGIEGTGVSSVGGSSPATSVGASKYGTYKVSF